jgi:hypothetical protein
MRQGMVVLISFAAGAAAAWAVNSFQSPSREAECMADAAKPGMSDDALALAIIRCQERFALPRSASSNVDLDGELESGEVALITGRASTIGSTFSVTLYNGNSAIELNSIVISVTTLERGDSVARLYTASARVPPNSAMDLSFRFVTGDDNQVHSWWIASARGRRLTPVYTNPFAN